MSETDEEQKQSKLGKIVDGIIAAIVALATALSPVIWFVVICMFVEFADNDRQYGVTRLRAESGNMWIPDYTEVVGSDKAEEPIEGETYYVCSDRFEGSAGLLVEDSEHNRKYITASGNSNIREGSIITYDGKEYQPTGYWDTQPQLEVNYTDTTERWGDTVDLEPGQLYYVRDSMTLAYRSGTGKYYNSFRRVLILIVEDNAGVKYQCVYYNGDYYGDGETPYKNDDIYYYNSKIFNGDIVRYRGYGLFSLQQSAWNTFKELEEEPAYEEKTFIEMLDRINWDKLPESIKRSYTFE